MSEHALVGPVEAAPSARVLVVDDDELVRASTRMALESAGFEAVVAADGAEALATVEAEPIDAILLDEHLPDISGSEVLHRLRQGHATGTIPVLMISGDAAEERRVAGLEHGANDYLAKPVSAAELIARLQAQVRASVRWQQRLDTRLAARRRLSREIAELDSGGSLETLATEVLRCIADELDIVDGAVRLVRADGLTAPVAQVAGDHAPGTQPHAGIDVPTGPHLERTPGAPLVHVPLQVGTEPYGVLSVTPLGEAEQVLSTLVDLAPQLAALLAPPARADRASREERREVEAALRNEAITPVFQPILSLRTGEIVGFEGLSRFADGMRPDLRFGQAQRVGLGVELDLAAIRTLLGAARGLPPDTWVSVNLSARTLVEADLAPALADADRPVRLEITEHESISDYDEIARAISRLPGTGLAVDDAGSGYASLRHAYELRPSMIKLDRGWVDGVDGDSVRQALVAGVLDFAGAMAADVVAEGIEREQEAACLREVGVGLAQGYFFARPAALDELLGRLDAIVEAGRASTRVPFTAPALAGQHSDGSVDLARPGHAGP